MERAEKIGLGIATTAHVLLFAALSGSWFGPPKPLKLDNKPIEVSIADDVALQSMAPILSPEPPPPTPGEVEGPPEEAAPAPSEAVSQPAPTPAPPTPKADPKPAPKPEPKPVAKPKPDPKPTPRPAAKPQPKPKPQPAAKPPAQKPAPAKPAAKPNAAAKPAAKPVNNASGKPTSQGTKAQSSGSKLKLDTSDWMKSASRNENASSKPNAGATASAIGPAQKSALDAEIRRQLKPHWKAPTGADAESLRTILTVRLGRDGSIAGNPEIVDTLGVTASNRTQVRLHQEQAIKAVRLAAPFKLPANLYAGWQHLQLTFDRRLSQ